MCSLTTQQHNDSMMQINDILQQKKMCGPLFCHTPAAASCNLLKIAIDTHAKFGMCQGNEQSRLGLFFSVANQSQVGNFFFFPVPPLLNG